MFGYNKWYVLIRFWAIPKHIYREIKWFIQRGIRGYSDRDNWDTFSYLLYILPPMLRDLRLNTHGCPVGLTQKKWEIILLRMENGLRDASKHAEFMWETEDERKRLWRSGERGLDLLRKHFYSLWD